VLISVPLAGADQEKAFAATDRRGRGRTDEAFSTVRRRTRTLSAHVNIPWRRGKQDSSAFKNDAISYLAPHLSRSSPLPAFR
jgi:hypothetical protein